MGHMLVQSFLHVSPVHFFLTVPGCFAPDNKDKKSESANQGDKASRDKGVLHACVSDPRCNTITNRKRKQVADDDGNDHTMTTHFTVTVNSVATGHRATKSCSAANHAHGNDGAHPMNVMRGTNTPKDKTGRRKNSIRKKNPKTVLSFRNSIVPTRKFHLEPVRSPGGIKTKNEGPNNRRNVGKTNLSRCKVVVISENHRGSSIKNVKPDKRNAIDETGPQNNGKSKHRDWSLEINPQLIHGRSGTEEGHLLDKGFSRGVDRN